MSNNLQTNPKMPSNHVIQSMHNNSNSNANTNGVKLHTLSRPHSKPSILHPTPVTYPPIPAALTYTPHSRKRIRTNTTDTHSLSPHIHKRRKLSQHIQLPPLTSPKSLKTLKLQTESRTLSPKTKTKIIKPSNSENVIEKDWSDSDKEPQYSDDDDYLPPIPKKLAKKLSRAKSNGNTHNSDHKLRRSTRNNSKTHSDSDSETDVVGYRKLNWRKKQVATPKFIVISNESIQNKFKDFPRPNIGDTHTNSHSHTHINKLINANTHTIITHTPPSLLASKSTIDMYGVVGDKLEDTSNKAYFHRHYRAEAREKLFYEELFESRMKQQQILEAKEKRRKKNKRRKSSHGLSEEQKSESDSECDMDLTLPKLPTGPWSYKLGSEYDKRPSVPKNVTNTPQFNYAIPFEKLRQRQFMSESDKCALDSWWVMPECLIRRTDYGNMGSVTVKVNESVSKGVSKGENGVCEVQKGKGKSESEMQKKQELIEMYRQLKEKEKLRKIEKKSKKHKHRHKKHKHRKDKHRHKKHKHRKSKSKDRGNGSVGVSGPIDVRLLLKK